MALLVNDVTPRVQYTATAAQAVFAYPFAIFKDADLKVYLTPAGNEADDTADIVVLTTDYTVSGAGTTSGGNVTLLAAATAGDIITIIRDLPIERTIDYQNLGDLSSETFNDDLDKIIMMMQQNERELETRTLKLLRTDSKVTNLNLPFPEPATALGWNTAGTAIENLNLSVSNIGDSFVVASKVLAASISLTSSDAGKKVFVTSADGGPFTVRYNATPGTYADNGGAYCGTVFIPTGGDGTIGLERDDVATINVKWFGAKGDTVTNDTAAIQAAIDFYTTGHGTVYIPPGIYLTTSQITIAQHRIHLVGSGVYATEIRFTPTADQTCIKVVGAVVVYQGSIRDMAFYTAEPTYAKTAINLVDTSFYLIDNVVIGGGVTVGASNFWSNGASGTSIGLQTNGREHTTVRKFFCYADKPIFLSANPNNVISADHYHFSDCYLASGNSAIITVQDLYMSQFTMDGSQVWVGGTYGFYYPLNTTAATSHGIVIKNVRAEQELNATDYTFYIGSTNIQQLLFENCYQGLTRNGFYIKGNTATLKNCYHVGSTNIGLNLFATSTSIENCFWQAGCTQTLNSQKLVYGAGRQTGRNIYETAKYVASSGYDENNIYAEGIQFPATQVPSSDVNTLDDYEEGSHAATLTGSTSGSFTLSSTGDTYAYTKIGRMVDCQGSLSVSSGSVVGDIIMSLPFAPTDLTDDQDYSMSSFFIANNGVSIAGQKSTLVLSGAMYFRYVTDAGVVAYIGGADVDTAFQIGFNFSYISE